MLRLRLLPVFVALAFAACSQPDSALRVDITVDTITPFATDCLRLSMLGSDGNPLPDGVATFVKPANGKAVAVVRRQSGWPQELSVRVEGYVGPALPSDLTSDERPAAEKARCADSDSLRLNARVEKANQAFPTSGINDVAVTLKRDAAKDVDADGDGFASVVGTSATRADCDDSATGTHYGQAQLCTTNADTDCNDLPGCDDPTCFGIGLCSAPPTRLVLVDGGVTGDLSLAQPSYTLIPLVYELRNANGQPRQAIRDTPVTVTADSMNVDLLGASPDGGFRIPVNGTQLVVGVRTRSSLLETVNVHLSATLNLAPDAGVASADTAVNFKPADVAQLVFLDAGVVAVPAATCSAQSLTLQLQDANNRPTIAPAGGMTVTFSVPGTINNGALFADGCVVPFQSYTFAAGESQVSMRLKYDTFGSYVAQASAPGLTTASYPFRVNAGGASRLGFFSTGSAVTTLALDTGVCSVDGQLFVGLLDAQGNPTTSTTDTPLTLQLSGNAPGDLGFYTSACTTGTQTLNFTLPANAGSLPLHVRGTTATTGDVTATMSTSASGIGPASMNVSIGAGPASTVEVAGTGQTITAGSCSTTPFTVRLKDANGNSVGSDAGVTVTLSGDADLTFFTDGGCSATGVNSVYLPPGAPEQLVTFRGTVARAFDLGSGVSSVPSLLPTGSVTGNVIQPGAAASVTLGPATLNISAGTGCGQLTAQVLDQYNNLTPFGLGGPAGGTTARDMTLSPPSTFKVSDDVACSTGNGVTLAAGASSVSLYLSTTVAGTYDTFVSPQGLGLNSNHASVTVQPGAASFVIRDAGTPWVVAAGDCRSAIISNEDVFGNPVVTTTSIAVDGGDGTQLFSGSGCTAPIAGGSINVNNTSALPLWLKPTKTGDRFFTAGGSSPLTLSVRPGATHHYAFEGTFPPVLTAGDCAGPVMLSRYDIWNNLADGGSETASLTSSPARVSYFTNGNCTGAAGAAVFSGGAAKSSTFFLGATLAGSSTMVAASGVAQGDAGLTVVPDAGHHLSFVTQPSGTLTAGACSGFTVEARDGFNNQVTTGAMVNLGADALLIDGGSNLFFAGPAGTCSAAQNSLTLTSGAPVGTFNFRPDRAGSVNVTASSGALVPATANFTVQPDVATTLAWQALPANDVQRFACADAGIVEAHDQFGNVATVSGATITWTSQGNLGASFFSDSDCTVSAASASIPSNGSATAAMFMKANGSLGTVRATASGAGALTGAQTPAQSVSVFGNLGQISVSPVSAPVEAFACVPFTVSRSNSSGAAVTTGTTDFTVTGSTGITLHADPACSGVGSTTLVSNITNGSSTQVIYVRGRSVDDLTNVTLTFSDNAAGFDAGTANAATLPLVRRGRCDLDGVSEVRCEVSPAIPNNDISRSFMFFSSTGSDSTASNANVACRLDSSGDAAVVCARSGSGALDNSGMLIEYQVVSYGRAWDAGGVSVQHIYDGGVTQTADVPYPVFTPPLGESFVLMSNWSSGSENSADDFMTGHLTGSGVRIQSAVDGAAKTYALQVVSWNGATVDRGSINLDAGVSTISVNAGTASSTTSNSFLLYSVRGADADAGSFYEMCKRQVRGSLGGGSPVQMTFSRGNGDANCVEDQVVIRWEVVTLPATAASTNAVSAVSFSGNNSGPYLNLGSSVVGGTANKSVAFLGGQGPGGQAGGESNFQIGDSTGDQTGPFHALLHLTTGNVNTMCRNPGSGRSSVFSPQVIQFNP